MPNADLPKTGGILLGTALELDASAMRKRYRVIAIAAFVGALGVPVGYALSIESQPHASGITAAASATLESSTAVAVVRAPVIVHGTASFAPPRPTAPATMTPMVDAGKLLLLASILFGLSALVRKAI